MVASQKVAFDGSMGQLSGRLDVPDRAIKAYALYAHCFTCSKDIFAAKRVASELASQGIAVLRFDFAGLGASEGDFAETNFTTNIRDLTLAMDYMRENHQAPKIMIGHSLGGAAVISAAKYAPEVKAVATIGAPADAHHVTHNFGEDLEKINEDGEAELLLAGRRFTIKKQFVEDLCKTSVKDHAATLKKALMVMHSPTDEIVGIENAAEIYGAAKHPKSFVSLDGADHLLSNEKDASYVAKIISVWADRFVGETKDITGSK